MRTPLASYPVTAFDIDTRHGLRVVEVWWGDVTRLAFDADVLVVSAFRDDYLATSGSTIGSLHRVGVSLRDLAASPAIDLRSTTGAWLSEPVGSLGIGRILCVERAIGDLDPGAFIRRGLLTLSILDAVDAGSPQSPSGRTVAMTLLGTGDQGLGEDAVTALIDGARETLHRAVNLARLCLVVYEEARAARVADLVNQALGVTAVAPDATALSRAVMAALRDAYRNVDRSQPFWREATRELDEVTREAPVARSIEIGIHGRRFVELLVRRLAKKKGSDHLCTAIDAIAKTGEVAPWIVSYMHAMRSIGNEAAHAKEVKARRPEHPSGADAVHALFCLERLVRYAIEYPQD